MDDFYTKPTTDDQIVAFTCKTFFGKSTTDDPWERTFLLFYEPMRMQIGIAAHYHPRLRELVLELARLTQASTVEKGRVQIAMRELAHDLAVALHRFASAVHN